MLLPTTLLLALASTVLGQTSLKSNTVCTTKYGSTSRANVPRTTTHLTSIRSQKVVVTSTITSTTRPNGLTTVTTTSTTVPNVIETSETDIATLTTTSTSTSTVFTTTTDTSTTTTTSTTTVASTTTRAAPVGFTAIAQQSDYVQKRAEGHYRHVRRATKSKKMLFPAATGTGAPGLHPTAVTCGVTTTRVSTSTVTTTRTTTLGSSMVTSTRTITFTTDSTSFVAPTSTTTTITDTATTTSTSTRSTKTTETATATATVAAFTYYGQCSDNNRISSVHGGIPIEVLSYNTNFSLQSETVDDDTGYDCCAICAVTSQCAGFGQHPDGQCFTIRTNSNTCDGSQTFGDAYHYYGDANSPLFYTVGNGQCGRLAAVSGPAGAV